MYRKRKSLKSQETTFRKDNSNSRVILKNRSGKKDLSQGQKKIKIFSNFPELSLQKSQKQKSNPSCQKQSFLQSPKRLPASKKIKTQPISLITKLNELDKKAEDIIYQKLLRKMGYNKKLTLMKIDSNTDQELTKVLKEVQQLSKSSIDHQIGTQLENYNFHNKKINLMEKLMAEQIVESENLKKDFFTISAINQRKKFQSLNQNNFLKTPMKQPRIIPRNKSRSITYQSTSKMSFKAPEHDDYEKYRYKQKDHILNRQPLPRSSYNSEYLIYDSSEQKMSFKNIDSFKCLNKSRQKSSTYSKDYKTIKTEKLNYKELDSYRNKLRDIKISYGVKKLNPEEDLMRRKRLMTEELYSLPLKRQQQKGIQNTKIVPKINLMSESKRQYPSFGDVLYTPKSQIKNRELTKLKYSYKGLAHA